MSARTLSSSTMTPGPRRAVDLLLFFTLLFAYGWFHQGGGWNQNSRWDQVRALVERGEFFINRYCVYRSVQAADGSMELQRIELPVNFVPDRRSPLTNTGDHSYFQGKVYPNKPPGTTLLAAPGYSIAWFVLTGAGLNMDSWWGMTLAAYLTTVLSMGVIGAIGGIVFHRCSRLVLPHLPRSAHVAATYGFALGTLMFPFSTVLFDHVAVAVLLLAALWLGLRGARSCSAGTWSSLAALAGSGLCSGLAVLTNYSALLAAFAIGGYLLSKIRSPRAITAVLAGGFVPAVGLMLYHAHCFGGPFTLATEYENPLFVRSDLVLGVFGAPRPDVALALLISPFRGLFTASPILAMGLIGVVWMLRKPQLRAIGLMIIAIFAMYLLMNASFNEWHGGSSFGPRYLIPTIPFLALGLAPAFAILPRITTGLAAVSIGLSLLATAVNPQVPDRFLHPVTEYLLPLAAGEDLATQAGTHGPVSANSQGIYEWRSVAHFPVGSTQVLWNSFNLGEFFWPQSWKSIAPLLLVCGGGIALTFRAARRSGS